MFHEVLLLAAGVFQASAGELKLQDAAEAAPALAELDASIKQAAESIADSAKSIKDLAASIPSMKGPALMQADVHSGACTAMTEDEAEELATEREKWGAWDDSDGRRRWGDFTVCRRRHDIQHDGRRRHEDRSMTFGADDESGAAASGEILSSVADGQSKSSVL